MNSAAGSWVCAEQSSEMPSDVRHTRPRHRSDIPLRSLQAGSGLTDGDSDAPSGGGKITRSMNFARALWRALTPDQGRQPYFASSVRSLGKPQLGQLLSVYVCPASPNGNRLFAIPVSREAQTALAKANHRLGSPDLVDSQHPASVSAHRIDAIVEGGATKGILDIAGPAAITRLRVKLDLPKDTDELRRLLRELVIRVTWDNDATLVSDRRFFRILSVGLKPLRPILWG